MLHAAVFADGQPFANGLQFFFASFIFFTRFQAFGGALVGGSHRPVALDVFPGFLVAVLRCANATENAALSAIATGISSIFLNRLRLFMKSFTLIAEVQTH